MFPVHPNPNVQSTVREKLAGHPRIRLLPPLEYPQFVAAMKSAHLILTDSGGVQEEAPSLGVPVLVLRDVTERTEGIKAGTARLVGSHRARIVAATLQLLDDAADHAGNEQQLDHGTTLDQAAQVGRDGQRDNRTRVVRRCVRTGEVHVRHRHSR